MCSKVKRGAALRKLWADPTSVFNTEEYREKLRESHRGIKYSKERNRNIGKAREGMRFSKEHKRKLSEAHKGQQVGDKNPMKRPENRKKISLVQMGSGNSSWKGGISNLPYPFEFNGEFRELIRERYDHTCMLCRLIQAQVGYTLNVHHVDYDKDNLDPDNFVPLCSSCHGITTGNRIYWTKVFQNIVEMNRRRRKMKRNWDTVREILLRFEEKSGEERALMIDAWPEDAHFEVSYHVDLLLGGGYLDGKMLPTLDRGPVDFLVFRLTLSGHELLDTITNPVVWKKTKESFISKAIPMTINLIVPVATEIAKGMLGV